MTEEKSHRIRPDQIDPDYLRVPPEKAVMPEPTHRPGPRIPEITRPPRPIIHEDEND